MRLKLRNPFANDPFIKTSVVWGLGLLVMDMGLTWTLIQSDSYDRRVSGIFPFILVILGAWYLIRFIGARPLFHCFLCGAVVGFGLATLGFIGDEFNNGLSWNGLELYLVLIPTYMLSLGLPALAVGWVRTRGRTPIEIELPDKKEEEAAKRARQEPPKPRIITPVSEMPGSVEANKVLLKQLEKDPTSLMSEHEREKLRKRSYRSKLKL